MLCAACTGCTGVSSKHTLNTTHDVRILAYLHTVPVCMLSDHALCPAWHLALVVPPCVAQHVSHVMQVPRILNPVVLVVDGLPDLCKDAQVKAYVDSAFGSVEQCR